MVTVQAKKLYVITVKKQANLCKAVFRQVIKILLKDISKLCTSSKRKKLASCNAARNGYVHCTYVRTRQQQVKANRGPAPLARKKMPASAKACRTKGPKTGTIEHARKTTDLTSKEVIGQIVKKLMKYAQKLSLIHILTLPTIYSV